MESNSESGARQKGGSSGYRCCLCKDVRRGLFKFPTSNSIQKRWLNFVSRHMPEFRLKPSSRLCSSHFTQDSFQNLMKCKLLNGTRLLLIRDAVPTIREGEASPLKQPDLTARHHRLLIREALRPEIPLKARMIVPPPPRYRKKSRIHPAAKNSPDKIPTTVSTREKGMQTDGRFLRPLFKTKQTQCKMSQDISSAAVACQSRPPSSSPSLSSQCDSLPEPPPEDCDDDDDEWLPDVDEEFVFQQEAKWNEELGFTESRSDSMRTQESVTVCTSQLYAVLDQCRQCASQADVRETHRSETCLELTSTCQTCQFEYQWHSSPRQEK